MDHFALNRAQLCSKGKRCGKSLSINWPLWQEGGMKVDEQTEKMMATTTGMQPLSSEKGIQAFSKEMTDSGGSDG